MEQQTICMADITESEREDLIKNMNNPDATRAYEERKREGWYNRDHKKDWCKEAREQKEKEERDKEAQVETLQQRNEILEKHARQIETEFNDYRDLTDRRLTQLAELVKDLLKEKPKTY